MDKIITEIIIGAVILTLLIFVIPVYRSSAELVRSAGEKIDANENIKEVTIGRLPAAGDIGSGRYILELIKYFTYEHRFAISVEFPDKMYLFRQDAYEDAFHVLKNDMMFELIDLKKEENQIRMHFLYRDTADEVNEESALL